MKKMYFHSAMVPLTIHRFQWVALQINQLHKLSRERDIKTRLGKLPRTLEDAYHEIYTRIQSQEGSASEVARRAFQWIMRSGQPVSPAMLVTVVCQDPTTDDIDFVDIEFDFVLESCQNLLKVEAADGYEFCRFSHLSVQEYLENNHFSQFSSDVLIAQVCLTFLTDPIQSSIMLELAGESSESSTVINTDKIIDSTMSNEDEESNKREVIEESKVFGGLGSIDESDEPLVFKGSRDIETANWAQEQNYKSEESTESLESNGYEEFSWSEEFKEEGLYEVREYAKFNWLIHVQRSGEIEGDFDSRLIVLLKRFLGSEAETTPAFQTWARSRKSRFLFSLHSTFLSYGTLDPPSQLALQIAGFGLHRMLKDSWEHVDPNQKNAGDNPLLAIAAEVGCASTVQSLLDKGAEIDASSIECPSALYNASLRGEESVVKVLLENGADVNINGGYLGSPLQAASSREHESIARLLLDSGADVNAQGGEYYTALQAASTTGDESIVGLLLAHGADVNAQGGRHDNALQAASDRGYEQMVRLLLAHGADMNAQGGEYYNALYAASHKGFTDTVKILLEHGALDQDGKALSAAASQGYKSTTAVLLQASKISVNDALVAACSGIEPINRERVEDIVMMLLDAGAVDSRGEALITAAREGFKEAVALLPKEHNVGLDEALTSACQQYTRPYDSKTERETELIVILLLKAGAVDREGHALKAATENDFEEAADLLREAAEGNGSKISEDAEGLSDETV